MCLDLARAGSLILSILTLYALFHAAFLDPSANLQERLIEASRFLALAAAVSLASGFIFRDWARQAGLGRVRLRSTLPVRLFCWSSLGMTALLLASMYLERAVLLWRPHYPR